VTVSALTGSNRGFRVWADDLGYRAHTGLEHWEGGFVLFVAAEAAKDLSSVEAVVNLDGPGGKEV